MISGGNLTYEIPAGVADDYFTVDPIRGIITTRVQFDRELKDIYTVPIYVIESSVGQYSLNSVAKRNEDDDSNSGHRGSNGQFDVATIVVKITDINDHAPEFRPGTCYPLAVPENREPSVVHTIVATDLDEGNNGDIIYSISGKKSVIWI